MLKKIGKNKIHDYPNIAVPYPVGYMNMDDIKLTSQERGVSRVLKEEFSHNRECDMLANSFATELAICLIENLKESPQNLSISNTLSDDFYYICERWLDERNYTSDIDDEVVVIIYLKQMMNVLRTAQIVEYSDSQAKVIKDSLSREKLSKMIFNSFWNDTEWDKIFPSDPEAAIGLKSNRNVILNLIQNKKRSTIEELANNFFELTGFSNKNNLFMISFVDFYLFSWLKNFGIISYLKSNNEMPVTIETTNFDKDIFLSFLHQEINTQENRG